MELDKFCCSGRSQSCRWSQRYGKMGYDRILALNSLVSSGSKLTWWRMVWRKLMREKKKIFDCSSPAAGNRVHVSYDPFTYAKNFDQGLISADPDDVSRSFSARFAVPPRIFEKNE